MKYQLFINCQKMYNIEASMCVTTLAQLKIEGWYSFAEHICISGGGRLQPKIAVKSISGVYNVGTSFVSQYLSYVSNVFCIKGEKMSTFW